MKHEFLLNESLIDILKYLHSKRLIHGLRIKLSYETLVEQKKLKDMIYALFVEKVLNFIDIVFLAIPGSLTKPRGVITWLKN